MIVVGIDGANPETLVDPARRGALENIGEVLEEGIGGTLWSVTTSSVAAWTAHLTGVEPERGGIEGFITDDRFVNTNDIAVETYPEILDARGHQVGLVNIPLTYPPFKLENGFDIPGQLTPVDETEYTRPSAIQDILDDHDYEIDIRYGDRQYSFVDAELEVDRQTLLNDVCRVERKRLKASRQLMDEREWDLFFVQVNGTDPMQHFFWDQMEDATLEETDMLSLYQIIDEFVGDIREAYPEEDVLLFSDHGFRRDVWGNDESTRQRWTKVRSTAGRLLPNRLKQSRVRQWGLDLLASGAAASPTSSGGTTPGSHDPAAVWILGGPAVETADLRVDTQFLDLPATILHLMGEPVPSAYSGRVRNDLLTIDREPESDLQDIAIDRRRESVTPHEEQLAHLGYVEMVEDDG